MKISTLVSSFLAGFDFFSAGAGWTDSYCLAGFSCFFMPLVLAGAVCYLALGAGFCYWAGCFFAFLSLAGVVAGVAAGWSY